MIAHNSLISSGIAILLNSIFHIFIQVIPHNSQCTNDIGIWILFTNCFQKCKITIYKFFGTGFRVFHHIVRIICAEIDYNNILRTGAEIPIFCIIWKFSGQSITIRNQTVCIGSITGRVSGNDSITTIRNSTIICIQFLSGQIGIGFHKVFGTGFKRLWTRLPLHTVCTGNRIPDKFNRERFFRLRRNGSWTIRSNRNIFHPNCTIHCFRKMNDLNLCCSGSFSLKQSQCLFWSAHNCIFNHSSIYKYCIARAIIFFIINGAIPCKCNGCWCSSDSKCNGRTTLNQPCNLLISHGSSSQFDIFCNCSIVVCNNFSRRW